MEKNQQNMQLDRPRLLLPEGSTARRWWFYMAVLALAGLGAWGSFITAFQLPVFPTALVAAGLLSCALTVWLQLAARRWRPVALLVWVVWLLLAVFLSCLIAWSPLSQVISSGFSIILCTLAAAGAGAWLFPREEAEGHGQ